MSLEESYSYKLPRSAKIILFPQIVQLLEKGLLNKVHPYFEVILLILFTYFISSPPLTPQRLEVANIEKDDQLNNFEMQIDHQSKLIKKLEQMSLHLEQERDQSEQERCQMQENLDRCQQENDSFIRQINHLNSNQLTSSHPTPHSSDNKLEEGRMLVEAGWNIASVS